MPSVEIDSYVLDTLLADLVGHDRRPSAFIVYLFLWRHTLGSDRGSTQVSLAELAVATGLSRRSVQEALAWLVKRRLISRQRESRTAVPEYSVRRPWLR